MIRVYALVMCAMLAAAPMTRAAAALPPRATQTITHGANGHLSPQTYSRMHQTHRTIYARRS